jgi:hypothetical protein
MSPAPQAEGIMGVGRTISWGSRPQASAMSPAPQAEGIMGVAEVPGLTPPG